MSRLDAEEPDCVAHNHIIDVLITAKSKDLGGFSVRRVLPSALARRVGPFVFFDEMGPAKFPPGEAINVRPHPHIGLATVTYLFEGEILHRDSLGYLQAIEPGAVNLMTAGSGIVHSERTSEPRLASGQLLHGIQVWMALPADLQEIEPEFVHYPKQNLPVIEAQGHKITVIIGSYNGSTSPVAVHLETLYLDQRLDQGFDTRLADDVHQRAVYLLSGNLDIDGGALTPGNMAVIRPGAQATLLAKSDCHFMVIGGEDVGERHIWWNFVHTSKDRIEQAKKDWRGGGFERIPGDDEYIPLEE